MEHKENNKAWTSIFAFSHIGEEGVRVADQDRGLGGEDNCPPPPGNHGRGRTDRDVVALAHTQITLGPELESDALNIFISAFSVERNFLIAPF